MSYRLLTAPLLLASVPAFAQESLPSPESLKTTMVTVGIGIARIPDYDGARESRWSPVPGVRASIDGMSFTLAGNRGWADLVPDNRGRKGIDWQLGPIFNINLSRAQKVKDARVAALGKVPVAIEAGVQAGIGYQGLITSDFDKLTFQVAYVHDVGGVHKSYVVTPGVNYATPLSRKALVYFSLTGDYAGGAYARRYFGVSPAGAAASGLPAYSLGSGWKDWSVGSLFDVALTGDLTGGIQLVGGGAYTRMIGDFAKSPVTRSRDQWIGALGLAYTF